MPRASSTPIRNSRDQFIRTRNRCKSSPPANKLTADDYESLYSDTPHLGRAGAPPMKAVPPLKVGDCHWDPLWEHTRRCFRVIYEASGNPIEPKTIIAVDIEHKTKDVEKALMYWRLTKNIQEAKAKCTGTK